MRIDLYTQQWNQSLNRKSGSEELELIRFPVEPLERLRPVI